MPLPDGTNAEGEDLESPLPYKTRLDIKTIVLYGTHASPATCKARALLNLAGVAFERRFGKHPTSSYRKFPVIVLNGACQVNDSHIMFKNLAPILFEGYTLSEKDVEIDRMVTFGLMLSCEKEAFGNVECMKQWAATAGLTGITGFFIRTFAPLSLAKHGATKIISQHPDLKTPVEYCVLLKEELDRRNTSYFNGDSTPGPLDASVYGCMAAWAPCGGEVVDSSRNMKFMAEAITRSGLSVWYDNMSKAIPKMWKLDGWFPFYT